MDGLEATAALRELERSEGRPRLPIVAMSAGVFATDRERCAAAGMDDFLAKPIDMHAFDIVLHTWMRKPVAAVTHSRDGAIA
jgi:CheY-like chemotaxis protein